MYVIGIKYIHYKKIKEVFYTKIVRDETFSGYSYNKPEVREWFTNINGAKKFDDFEQAKEFFDNNIERLFNEERKYFPKSVKLEDFKIYKYRIVLDEVY